MDRLLAEIRKSLEDGPRRPHPGPPPRAEAVPVAALEERFAAALVRAGGRFVRVGAPEEAEGFLDREYAGRRVVRVEDSPSRGDLLAADVGVDRADVLLVETGTLLRSYASREEGRISLVPPVTVFLATSDRLVPDLPAAIGRIEAAHRAGSAYTVLVTGPSRTADIEKQLVIPAHGPRELVVVLAP